MLEHLAAENLWSRARSLMAGDEGRGLIGSEYQAWASRQPQDTQLSRFRELEGVVKWREENQNAARQACREADRRKRVEAFENGLPLPDSCDPANCEFLLKHVDAVSARLAAMGIPGKSVAQGLDAVQDRLRILANLLEQSYRRSEPEELQKLRGEIAEAALALWPASEALRIAQERCRVVGTALGEAACVEANTALNAAGRKHQELRSRLWTEWALHPGS